MTHCDVRCVPGHHHCGWADDTSANALHADGKGVHATLCGEPTRYYYTTDDGSRVTCPDCLRRLEAEAGR